MVEILKNGIVPVRCNQCNNMGVPLGNITRQYYCSIACAVMNFSNSDQDYSFILKLDPACLHCTKTEDSSHKIYMRTNDSIKSFCSFICTDNYFINKFKNKI